MPKLPVLVTLKFVPTLSSASGFELPIPTLAKLKDMVSVDVSSKSIVPLPAPSQIQSISPIVISPTTWSTEVGADSPIPMFPVSVTTTSASLLANIYTPPSVH